MLSVMQSRRRCRSCRFPTYLLVYEIVAGRPEHGLDNPHTRFAAPETSVVKGPLGMETFITNSWERRNPGKRIPREKCTMLI